MSRDDDAPRETPTAAAATPNTSSDVAAAAAADAAAAAPAPASGPDATDNGGADAGRSGSDAPAPDAPDLGDSDEHDVSVAGFDVDGAVSAPTVEPATEQDAERDAAERRREIARVTALFTRSEASTSEIGGERFQFARWTRPLAPAVFGVSEESVSVIVEGVAEAAEMVGLGCVDEDPDLGANLLFFFCDAWPDLKKTPNLPRLIPDLDRLLTLLAAAGANQYRIFTFGPDGGLRLCVVLLRYDAEMAQFSPASLALGQATQALLLWSDEAFANDSPVTVRRGGKAMIKSRYARLLKAAYQGDAPAYSTDPALAEALVDKMQAAPSGRRRRGRSDAEEGRRTTPGGDDAGGVDSDAHAKTADDPSDSDPAEADSAGGRSRRRRSRRRSVDGRAPGARAEAEGGGEIDPIGGDPRDAVAADDEGGDGVERS